LFQLSGFDLGRFEHSHGGDDWHAMNEVTPSHDAAESDPERAWQRGRIFRCASCEDEIRVTMPEDAAAGRNP
jgi:hypothetical protein